MSRPGGRNPEKKGPSSAGDEKGASTPTRRQVFRNRSSSRRRSRSRSQGRSIFRIETVQEDSPQEKNEIELKSTSSAGSNASQKHNKKKSSSSRKLKGVVNEVRKRFSTRASTTGLIENDRASEESAEGSDNKFAKLATTVVQTQRAAKGFKTTYDTAGTDDNTANYLIDRLHVETKKLDLLRARDEYKEVRRSQFYQELIVYLVFLAVLMMLLSTLPVYDSYEQSFVVKDLLCRDSISCDITTPEQIFEFARHVRSRVCTHGASDAYQLLPVGGVRFRQIRVQRGECTVAGGWHTKCYPTYRSEEEDKAPIRGQNDTLYVWTDGLAPLAPDLQEFYFLPFSGSVLGDESDFGDGGYVVDLCDFDEKEVDALEIDQWISHGTRAVSLEFTLVNPSTKIFTIGLHVFSLKSSGFLKHYALGSNVRLAFASQDPLTRWSIPWDSRVILWICCVLFLVTYARVEAHEMKKLGLSSYLKTDLWNLFELIQLYIVASLLYCCFSFYIESYGVLNELESDHLQALEYVNMQPILHIYQRLTDNAALAVALSLLKVFKYLRMNSTLSLLWQVLGMATRDLMGFLVIFNLIFFAYSYMGSLAFGFALEEFSSFRSSYATCFQMVAGNFDYEHLHRANPRIAPLFFGSFVVLVLQIVVNMFVAILSEYYEVVKSNSALPPASMSGEEIEYDIIKRWNSYLEACSPSVVLPANQALELTSGQTIRLISTNLVDKEVSRQRAKKLFRGAVWRVVALLRFGVKFDRHIRITHNRASEKEASLNQYINRTLHVPLSENFDHRTIKVMLPKGIIVRLEGDSLVGSNILLRVERHSSLSIECKVINDTGEGNEDEVLELLGGEYLRIPWQYFALHVLRTLAEQFRVGIMRALKFWDPLEKRLVDDYHLDKLFKTAYDDGRTSLRFDELMRVLNLYMRKDQKAGLAITPQEVHRETAQVMYHYRNSLIDMPSREKEGFDYRPNPLDTSSVDLGSLDYLSDMLAENCHDIWALERVKQGWKYGLERDGDKLTHPNLVPYQKLPPTEQMFDYRTSMETLKTILSLNFQIVRSSNASSAHYLRNSVRSRSSSSMTGSSMQERRSDMSNSRSSFTLRQLSSIDDDESDSPYFVEIDGGEIYWPRPINTSGVVLPPRLTQLVDLLAENAHEVWSKGRMDEGWTYGPARDDKSKKHPCLVPFVFLSDVEKEYDVNTAMGTLKMLLAMGFDVVDKESR